MLLEWGLLFLYMFLEMDEGSGNLLNIPVFHIHSMMVWKNPININFLFLYRIINLYCFQILWLHFDSFLSIFINHDTLNSSNHIWLGLLVCWRWSYSRYSSLLAGTLALQIGDGSLVPLLLSILSILVSPSCSFIYLCKWKHRVQQSIKIYLLVGGGG